MAISFPANSPNVNLPGTLYRPRSLLFHWAMSQFFFHTIYFFLYNFRDRKKPYAHQTRKKCHCVMELCQLYE